MQDINTILLRNILPAHVAEIFLDPNRADQLYHENHARVCVMFASIPNFHDFWSEWDMHRKLECLRLLNEIICEFDKVRFKNCPIFNPKYPSPSSPFPSPSSPPPPPTNFQIKVRLKSYPIFNPKDPRSPLPSLYPLAPFTNFRCHSQLFLRLVTFKAEIQQR